MSRRARRLDATISITDIPEMIAIVRTELADLLRQEAADETHPHTAARLRELAARFETGQLDALDDDSPAT